MLNFNQFRIFYHTVRHGNFTRAAAALYISQPAVTAQIKAFEAFCGFKLFKKKGRRNWLTDEGRLLYRYAEAVFGLETEIENTLDDMRNLKRGVLRIGTTKAYARYFMPLMLRTFHYKYPDIKIELNEGSSLEMTLSLLDFKNEIVIIAKAEAVPGIDFIPFSQEEVRVIVAPDHRLAGRRDIPLPELASEPFIMKDKGSGTRTLVDRLFTEAGCRPNILMEVGNTEFIKQLVQRGDGVSILIRESVAAELESGALQAIPLQGPPVYLDVSIAYLTGQPLSPPARALMATLETLHFGRKLTPQGIGAYMARILSNQPSPSAPGDRRPRAHKKGSEE